MTNSFEICPLRPCDVATIADIQRRCVLGMSSRFYGRTERECWAAGINDPFIPTLARQGRQILTATAPSGAVLGFCEYRCVGGSGEIGPLFAAPEAQGRGVGRALLRAAEAACQTSGGGRMSVQATLSAMAFFERQGYQVLARMRLTIAGGLQLEIRQMEKTL